MHRSDRLEAAAQGFERKGERGGSEVCGCPDVGAGGRGATRETKSGTAKRMRRTARGRMEGGQVVDGGALLHAQLLYAALQHERVATLQRAVQEEHSEVQQLDSLNG